MAKTTVKKVTHRSKPLTKLEKHRAFLTGENKELKGYIVLTYEYHPEGSNWVATCVELGTSTFARTLASAQRKINDAVICHLNCLEDVGERQRFFKENGIKLLPDEPNGVSRIDIPRNTTGFYQSVIFPIPVSTGAAA
jgi:hypothetical protein